MKIRFNIRELILATIIIGMAIGWWIDHRKWVDDFYNALDRGTRLAKERDAMEAEKNRVLSSMRQREFELRQLEQLRKEQARAGKK